MIYIVGPFRTGGSILAAVLNKIKAGTTSRGPMVTGFCKDKPITYRSFENKDVKLANELLIKLVDDTKSTYNPPSYESLINVVTDLDPCEYLNNDTIIKDPVLCLTLPLWLECTKQDPIIIYTHRDTADLLKSLIANKSDYDFKVESESDYIKLINLYYGYRDITDIKFVRGTYRSISVDFEELLNIDSPIWKKLGDLVERRITKDLLRTIIY